MNYRVLICEDDKGIAEGITSSVEGWGMESACVSDFRAVMSEFAAFKPHIVLMDITLPYMDGYHWCSEIRKVSSVPVIFISSASDSMNIVMAMNLGADDFIAKPFDRNVLIAKINAILRRTYDYGGTSTILEHNGAILNLEEHSISTDVGKLELSKNEFLILHNLMQNKGKVVSRESLMKALWETDSFVDENTLTVNIGRLRKKLVGIGLDDYIATKFGEGYIIG